MHGDARAASRHGRGDQDLIALPRLQAPVAQQRRERVGIRPHGACSSGKFSVTCSRSASRTNRRSSWRRHPVAGQQLLLAADLQPGDRPRHRQALEQQLHRPLPGVLPIAAAGERVGVLAPSRRSQRAAQSQDVALVVAVVRRRSLQLVARGTLAAASSHDQRGGRGVLQLGDDVAGDRIGVARPGRPTATSRRACGSTRGPARCRC